MKLYEEFLEEARDFNGYEDLKNNFKIKIPENFNFAYDVVDRYASEDPISLQCCIFQRTKPSAASHSET